MISPRFQISNQVSISITHTTLHHYNIELFIHDALTGTSISEYITQTKLEELIKFLQEQVEIEVVK